jgi:large subunit ribosomal protein L6e
MNDFFWLLFLDISPFSSFLFLLIINTIFSLSMYCIIIIGPYGINGVPLRRVNQRYVIATSTKIDVSNIDVSNVNDAFFAREKKATKKSETALFDANTKASERLSPERKALQDQVDAVLSTTIAKVASLGDFLKAKFQLRNGDKPHLLKF